MRLIDRLFRLEEINGREVCPTYLYRWTLARFFGIGVYLHKFVGDDWSVDLHDHPKRFISFGLWGAYMEHTPDAPPRIYRAPWIRSFPATHVHRLTGPTPEHPCWTLVIVLRQSRRWGFWPSGRWVFWRDYVESERAVQAKSCPD